MKPLISVIVATYRREKTLVQALASLAAQTFRDFEIVLVDDNDDLNWNATVYQIVMNFQENHEEIATQYLVNHPNQGSARTRNAGIAASKGEYVTFLDDDDIYLPEKLKRQVSFMQENGYDYCVTDLNLFNENDKLIDRRVRGYIQKTSREALQRYHLMYHLTGTDTMMFRKDYLVQIGGFAHIDVGDEYYLMHRAIAGGGKFGYLPGSDVKAYVHIGEGGLSSGEGKIKGEKALYAYKKQYFAGLSRKDRKFIKMRHYAVLAFAELRRKRLAPALWNAMLSFVSSPRECVKLLRNRGN